MIARSLIALTVAAAVLHGPAAARGEGEWEITPQSREALDRGLQWLARNEGPKGNWESNDLGLVSLGALAFLADGHTPGRGPYGDVVQKALDYVLSNAKPSGLLNISDSHRDMYNHGLSAFVLGQADGMTTDSRIGPVLDRALKLIANTQCDDGGWRYEAKREKKGNDLSLAVMQAKALRSAVDSGFEVPPEVIELAIRSVREHYRPDKTAGGGDKKNNKLIDERSLPGQFTYKGGGGGSLAMAACGVVCLQEFGQYDDWRIPKSMEAVVTKVHQELNVKPDTGNLPLDAYTMYYVGQSAYQRGGKEWRELYPLLRDAIVKSQIRAKGDARVNGVWHNTRHVSGKPGDLYATSVGCFILAMPNRYLPILQEGKIEGLRKQFQ